MSGYIDSLAGADGYGDYYSGDPTDSTAVGVPSVPSASLPGDQADAQQMQPYTPQPAAQHGAPWWAGIIGYGVVKAIDNQFPGSPTGVWGNTYPGSGAGANGRTYTQNPIGIGGGVNTTRNGGQFNVQVSPMLLVLVLGALVLMK